MKNKGHMIYSITSIILLVSLVWPNSTTLFSLEISRLINLKSWVTLVPDIVSIAALLLGYGMLKVFYSKRSKYVKWYPVYAFVVVMIWTTVVQFKWR